MGGFVPIVQGIRGGVRFGFVGLDLVRDFSVGAFVVAVIVAAVVLMVVSGGFEVLAGDFNVNLNGDRPHG